MRREFELTNGDGDAISLNDKKGLLGVDPEGLGISISNNFNASNGNQRLVECEANFEEFKHTKFISSLLSSFLIRLLY